MIKKVGIAEFGKAVNELAKGKLACEWAGSLGILLWILLAIDCLLTVRGVGLPSVSGALVVRGYEAAIAEAVRLGDEAGRLALYDRPYTGLPVWLVLGSQCIGLILGGALLLVSQPSRWLSEWLRPPRPRAPRLLVVIACVTAAAAMGWVLYALWSRVLGAVGPTEVAEPPRSAPDLNSPVSLIVAVFVVGALLSSALLPVRMQQLKFVFRAVAVSIIASGLAIMAGKLLILNGGPFRLTDRPFDVVRAVDALIAAPIVLGLLLWLAFEHCSRLTCATFEIVPTPDDSARTNPSHDQSSESGLPRFFVRLPKFDNQDYCGFKVVDQRPRTIAVPLEYNRLIEFRTGRLAFLRLTRQQSSTITISNVALPGGFQVSGEIVVTVSDSPLAARRGVLMPASDGRQCFDWELVQRLFRTLGGVDLAHAQAALRTQIRALAVGSTGVDLLIKVMQAHMTAAAGRALAAQDGIEAAVADSSVSRSDRPESRSPVPSMYGPSPSGSRISHAQVLRLTQAVVSLNEDYRKACTYIDDLINRVQQGLLEANLFDRLVSDVRSRDAGLTSLTTEGTPDVGQQLLDATIEAFRSVVQIQCTLQCSNADALFAQLTESVVALNQDIEPLAKAVREGAVRSSEEYQRTIAEVYKKLEGEGAIERIRVNGQRFAATMQMLSTPFGKQAVDSLGLAQQVKDSFERPNGANSANGQSNDQARNGPAKPAASPNPAGRAGTSPTSGSEPDAGS